MNIQETIISRHFYQHLQTLTLPSIETTGFTMPVLCRMEGVPPKSEKAPLLVLRMLIRIQADLNVNGLLYREPLFCEQFASLAQWNFQSNDCQFLLD